MLLLLTGVIAVSFSVPALIALQLRFALSWVVAGCAFAFLVLGCFAASTIWLTLVLIRALLVVGVVVTVSCFLNHPPLLAALLTVSYFVAARLMVALLMMVRPAVPLSYFTMGGTVVGLALSSVAGFGWTTGYYSEVLAASWLG